ncbi:hypothetical protein G6F62_014105 [Rhizopus arrhizus]|nr:hypothetical protein G6F62_014105 [Rhizopus arrhizus]KAG1361698.1 hypothetical protein G6F61_014186 [Rhizopus arrhizus]
MGLQAGLDVWAAANDNHRNQIGVFVGRTRAQGKTTGLALGWENVQVGQNRLDDKHVGLYWTLTGSTGGYIDAVAMQSRYDGRCVGGGRQAAAAVRPVGLVAGAAGTGDLAAHRAG